jgi:hypothetical protein
MEKLNTLLHSWIISLQKQMQELLLETNQSGGKLLPHSDIRWGVFLEETPRGKSHSEKDERNVRYVAA